MQCPPILSHNASSSTSARNIADIRENSFTVHGRQTVAVVFIILHATIIHDLRHIRQYLSLSDIKTILCYSWLE